MKQNEVLLVKHTYGTTKGKWDFIRGYIEAHENLEEAVIREVAGMSQKLTGEYGIMIRVKDLEKSSSWYCAHLDRMTPDR